MSLSQKVLLILAGVFLAAGASSVIVNNVVILPNFETLERTESEKNTYRVLEALNQEIEGLGSTVSTWGWWDDAFAFVEDHNPAFAGTNLTPEAVAGPQVDFVAFYNLAGRRIGAGMAGTDAARSLSFGELGAAQLPAEHPLFKHPGPRSGVGGLLASPTGPLLAVSWPVRKSNGEGPTVGSCIMVRPLDATMMERLSRQTKLRFTLTSAPLSSTTLPRPGADDLLSVQSTPPKLLTTEDAIVGVTDLADVHGHRLLTLKVFTPRDISARGWTAVQYALMHLGAASIVLFMILLAVMQRTLFKPLARLTAHVVDLGSHADLNARLNLQRNDELGTLAKEFDLMAERLAEARQRLAEQSFDSGRADMAAGILHNIGNAMTPLSGRLARLDEVLRSAPLAHVERAVAELSAGTGGAERQADLEQFLRLGSTELVRLLRVAHADVTSTIEQLHHTQQILTDQERFSRSREYVEPVPLVKVIRQSYAELAPELQESMSLAIDPSVAGAGHILGSWVAIRQVVSNLLINAAEAMLNARLAKGRMQVRCSLTHTATGAAVHTEFIDNGTGIEAAHLSSIFNAGFSTKQRGSGAGLHWCANAVSAMRGRLYAESIGPGHGATFHLIMPATAMASVEG